ncbi:hypothetical protein FA15DRAFT_593363 [Coprinopsis marcescibilis]|uniref:Uncharacterized protein n=1 Tax=Coprinopsis marcescibilis TaxID=230819 RepID=A0A5C3KTS9_COPMA|nr:hypothetical protein FA15DRAFT_593363 [Coprinopsis marcescibilis]
MAQCSVRSSTLSLSHRLQGPKRNVFRQASRFTSTVTASANNSSRNAAPAAAHGPQEPLTLLHKVSSLLPRALDGQGSGSSLTVDIWEKVLARAFEDLSSSAQRPLNITVYGLDRAAGAEDLVTALVVDPLGSDEQWKAVHERWSGSASNHLNISQVNSYSIILVQSTFHFDRHDAQISTDITASTIRVPSTYLQRFPVPIEITELRSASSPITSSGMLDGKTLTALFQSDIPILVCNPLLTSLPTLLSTTLFPQKTIIILRSPHVQQSTCDIIQTLLANVPPNAPKPTIILADPSRASSAVRSLLHSNQRSSSVVQRFQDDFIGSNVSAITQVLQELLQAPEAKAASSSKHQKGTASDYLRVKFGLLRLEDAVAACLSSIRDVKSQLDQTSLLASRLETLVEEEREKVEIDVLGPVEGSPQTRNARGNQVAEALKVAEVQMQDVMNRLTWWRMIWRVDEITGLVAAAMERTWCPELERKASPILAPLMIHTHAVNNINNNDNVFFTAPCPDRKTRGSPKSTLRRGVQVAAQESEPANSAPPEFAPTAGIVSPSQADNHLFDLGHNLASESDN